jgi:ppGpp synthetase/RelA/SpoT-type nucleotidyltranferase
MAISKMQDVGGIRIIVPKISDVQKVHDALKKNLSMKLSCLQKIT